MSHDRTTERLRALLDHRIVFFDGAMGTMIQRASLGEADFRGERFADHPGSLQGNNDLLVLTRPDVIREIHEGYLDAGADIVETNTFNATSIALAAGFVVFATSSFQPVVNFGLLSAMVILVALLATFVLTPLLLGSSELLTVWDLLSYRVQKDALQRSPLFQGMYIWQIKKLLLASEVRTFSTGEMIIREGDEGSEMFVVLQGRVEAQKRSDEDVVKHLRRMEVGDLFGEVGPLSGGKRTADVQVPPFLPDTEARWPILRSWY